MINHLSTYFTFMPKGKIYSCNCCWNVTTVWFHNLSNKLCASFIIFMTMRDKLWKDKVKLREVFGDPSHYNNFQKLKYFWLVERDKEWYSPTNKWVWFFLGEWSCEDRVATLTNRVLPYDHECREDKVKHKVVMKDDFDLDWLLYYHDIEHYRRESLIIPQ